LLLQVVVPLLHILVVPGSDLLSGTRNCDWGFQLFLYYLRTYTWILNQIRLWLLCSTHLN